MKKIRFFFLIAGFRLCDLFGGRLCGYAHPISIQQDYPETWWDRWF